jgi:hypothetical protein
MSVNRYLVYRISNGYVENDIILDETSDWQPPSNTAIEKVEFGQYVGIGWIRTEKGVYEAPAVQPIMPTQEEAQAALDAQIAELEAKNATTQ